MQLMYSHVQSCLHLDHYMYLFLAALKQDFATISGGWDTASQLGSILCQGCVGLILPEDKEYGKTFLPDVVENVLTLAAKLLDFSVKARLVSLKDLSCRSWKCDISYSMLSDLVGMAFSS